MLNDAFLLDEQERPPRAVSEATFNILGVTLRCYVLENGLRIINADDFHTLLERLDEGVDPMEFLQAVRDADIWARGESHASDS